MTGSQEPAGLLLPLLILLGSLAWGILAWELEFWVGFWGVPTAMIALFGAGWAFYVSAAMRGTGWKPRFRNDLLLAWAITMVVGTCGTPVVLVIQGLPEMFMEEDHSADEWFVPTGIQVDIPEGWGSSDELIDDPLLEQLLDGPESGAAEGYLDTRLPALERVARVPGELERRLSRSPRWRVHEVRGHRSSPRLLPFGGRYRVKRNDFYTNFDFGVGVGRTDFQIRLTIGLDGQARSPRHVDEIPSAATVSVPTRAGQGGATKSWIAIRHGSLVVEVFEESSDISRARTRAALADLERELTLPPEEAEEPPVRSQLVLHQGMQGGIYEMEARVDVNESGTVYVRAYEVSTGTPLSARRIAARTRTRVHGSSEDVQTVRSEFTIYEGNWEHHYAARIELWFVPDDGGAERKLIERVYRVEGWMR